MPPTPRQDAFDLLLLIGWNFIHGFIFASLFDPLRWDAWITGSTFALVGGALTFYGIERRQRGRFPPLLGIMLWAIPLNFSIFGVMWWLMLAIERWQGN